MLICGVLGLLLCFSLITGCTTSSSSEDSQNTEITTPSPTVIRTTIPTIIPTAPTRMITSSPTPTATKTQVPTSTRTPSSTYCKTCWDCSGNIYNCGDFSSQAEAQACYKYCLLQTGKDIHRLDGDNDGIACESLK